MEPRHSQLSLLHPDGFTHPFIGQVKATTTRIEILKTSPKSDIQKINITSPEVIQVKEILLKHKFDIVAGTGFSMKIRTEIKLEEEYD